MVVKYMLEIFERIFLSSKIKKLEEENMELKKDLRDYKESNETLQKRLDGERICGEYCDKCKHKLVSYVCGMPWRYCMLDCKCKDFEHV